ncbi:MAG: SDR family oxidoreductase [Sphingomonadales bacterium]
MAAIQTQVLITGANRGLGLEMAQLYAAQPNTNVIACCRTPDTADALTALKDAGAPVTLEALDVLDHNAIKALAERYSETPIDIVISNAGIFGKTQPATTGFQDQQFGRSDFEADWIMPYRVNVIAAMALAEAFASHIEASQQKKLVLISSMVASITNAMGHMFGYAASKAALNMTARNLAVALKPRGIIVNPIHPGYARTDMSGPQAAIEPIEGAEGVVAQIKEMTLEGSGAFLSYDGREMAW